MTGKTGYHHGDLRSALVAAARELVEQHGPDRVSLSSACRAAGVSTAAPYRHFADKDALLRAVAMEAVQRQHDALAAAAAAHPAGSPAAIVAIGMAYVDFAQREPGAFRLVFGLASRQADVTEVLQVGRDNFILLLTHIGRLMGVPPDDPGLTEVAVQLWSMAHGLAFMAIDGSLLHMGVDLHREALIAGFVARLLPA